MRRFRLPLAVFLFSFTLLTFIQIKPGIKMLLLERFIDNGGWIEIILICLYGSLIAYKMQDQKNSSQWRLISWSVFSVWFFLQLILGLLLSDKFLLTGRLHIPVPAMMIGGPIYRYQLSVMTLLFLSTIVLSGPAWCSQLCYFGAFDGMAANIGKAKMKKLSDYRMIIKNTVLFSIILIAIVFRWIGVSVLFATIAGIAFGLIGLIILFFKSPKKGKMFHCVIYCPIGTLVNYLKFFSLFRFRIDNTCSQCMACLPKCRYDALNIENIRDRKPGITCTLCGDCIASCDEKALHYDILKLNPRNSRFAYLFITISLHILFMAMGRI
jgi:ferredoxin-type protein NapH